MGDGPSFRLSEILTFMDPQRIWGEKLERQESIPSEFKKKGLGLICKIMLATCKWPERRCPGCIGTFYTARAQPGGQSPSTQFLEDREYPCPPQAEPLHGEKGRCHRKEELSPFLERRLEEDVQVHACTCTRTCVSSYYFCVFIALISARMFFLSPSFCLLCVYSAFLFLGSWGGSSDYWSETPLLMPAWGF